MSDISVTVSEAAIGVSVVESPIRAGLPAAHSTTEGRGLPDQHPIAAVTGLQTALDAKAPLVSPAFTDTPTAPTAAPDTSTTQIATTAFAKAEADAAQAAAQAASDPAGSAATAQALAVQRGNHTGTQLAATISDFDAAAVAATAAAYDVAGAAATAQAYAVQRSNHSGTQLAATISDFAAAALAATVAAYDPAGSAATAQAAAAIDATAKAEAAQAYAIQRSNHTGTQLAATISDFNAQVLALFHDLDYFAFDIAAGAPAYGEGRIYWDAADHTVAVMTEDPGVILQVGQEFHVRATNKTGGALANGTVVYVDGAQGSRPTVAPAIATSSLSDKVIGLCTADIANNATGYVSTAGLVRGIDTSAWVEGTELYVSAAVAGGLTSTRPTAPDHAVSVGIVLHQHAVNGIILVRVGEGAALSELHDVAIAAAANKHALRYVAANNRWENTAQGAWLDTVQTFTQAQTISAAVASTNTTTGALVLTAGGLGVAGAGNFGGGVTCTTLSATGATLSSASATLFEVATTSAAANPSVRLGRTGVQSWDIFYAPTGARLGIYDVTAGQDRVLIANGGGAMSFLNSSSYDFGGGITCTTLTASGLATAARFLSGTDGYPNSIYQAHEAITAHAHYAFLDDSTVDFTAAGGGASGWGHASFDSNITINGSVNFDHHYDYQAYCHYSSSGIVNSLCNYFAQPDCTAGTVTALAEFSAHNPTGAGTIGALYGFYCAGLTRGAANYAVYTAGTTPSFFGGLVITGTGYNATVADSTAGFKIQRVIDDSQFLFAYSGGAFRFTATYGTTGAFKDMEFWTSDTLRYGISASGTHTFYGGITCTTLSATSTAASTSTTTGCATFGGGIGVAGAVFVGGNSTALAQIVDGAALSNRAWQCKTSGTLRWNLNFPNAESGANAGTDLVFEARNDAGSVIGNALSLSRSTLSATFGHSVTASDHVSGPKVRLTPEGGIATLVVADEAISVGHICAIIQGGTANRVKKCPISGNENDMPVGVAYTAAGAAGDSFWMVVSGRVGILPDTGTTAAQGYIIYTSATTAGLGTQAATAPAAATHFKEVGHFLNTGSGAGAITDAIVHFN